MQFQHHRCSTSIDKISVCLRQDHLIKQTNPRTKCKQAYLLTACYLHTCRPTLASRKCSVKTTLLKVSALPHLCATEVNASRQVSRLRDSSQSVDSKRFIQLSPLSQSLVRQVSWSTRNDWLRGLEYFCLTCFPKQLTEQDIGITQQVNKCSQRLNRAGPHSRQFLFLLLLLI